jgi:clan AA aspartic protease
MGIIYAEITLKNAKDVSNSEDGLIKESEIHQETVQAMVDTGCFSLVINEGLFQKLGLKVKGLRRASFANGEKEVCKVTEPVEIHWKNRSCSMNALVIPNSSEVLLGALPLEDMDLIINPAKQELAGAHGDEIVSIVM